MAKEEEGAEKARLDERWDRLAAGTLTAEEEAELLALAETSPEAREVYEAFRPLGPEFQARVVETIAKKRRGRVLPFPPAVRIGGWLTAAAAAAAVVVVLLRPAAPLPGYQMGDVSRISAEMRGELTEEPLVFAPGDRIQIVLHPETAFRAGRLRAQLFLLQNTELRPLRLDDEPETDPGGAVKLKAELDRDLQPGDWTLWAVVGRPGDLPDPAELRPLVAQGGVRQRDWAAASKGIRIRSP